MTTHTTHEYRQMLEIIKDFASEKLSVDKASLTEKTRIEEDVSVAGLDTITFYDHFFTDFEIVNPEDFPLGEYVTSENLQLALFSSLCFPQSTGRNCVPNTPSSGI